jgi:hypothetical protein
MQNLRFDHCVQHNYNTAVHQPQQSPVSTHTEQATYLCFYIGQELVLQMQNGHVSSIL